MHFDHAASIFANRPSDLVIRVGSRVLNPRGGGAGCTTDARHPPGEHPAGHRDARPQRSGLPLDTLVQESAGDYSAAEKFDWCRHKFSPARRRGSQSINLLIAPRRHRRRQSATVAVSLRLHQVAHGPSVRPSWHHLPSTDAWPARRPSARRNRDLGFADVWISDRRAPANRHIRRRTCSIDRDARVGAAVTESIDLDERARVAAHNPLELRHAGSIDCLVVGSCESGRCRVVAAWFDALGYDFADRDARTDRSSNCFTAWRDDPASFHGALLVRRHYYCPPARIDLGRWGNARTARRALGDGYQIIGVTPMGR